MGFAIGPKEYRGSLTPATEARADYASAPRMHIERVLRHVDAARIRQRHFRVQRCMTTWIVRKNA